MIRAGRIGSVQRDYIDWAVGIHVTDDLEWDNEGRTMISHIYISFDEVINSIQFGYMENGALVLSQQYGSCTGHNFKVARLEEDEYVTGLTGVLSPYGGIQSLTIFTNLGKHGPFGSSEGKRESGPKVEINPAIRDRREFGGFFGSYSTTHLTSIGMYFSPIVGSSQRMIEHDDDI